MSAQVNDGDWVEGAVQWWWKYVLPSREIFWTNVIARVSELGPSPDPWREQVGEILAGIAMLRSSAKVSDRAVAEKLSKESISKINGAVEALQKGRAQ